MQDVYQVNNVGGILCEMSLGSETKYSYLVDFKQQGNGKSSWFKGATPRKLAQGCYFIVRNPTQSSPDSTVLMPFWFVISSLMPFYFSKLFYLVLLLFSCFFNLKIIFSIAKKQKKDL